MDRLHLDERISSAIQNFAEAVTTTTEDEDIDTIAENSEHNEATTDINNEYPYAGVYARNAENASFKDKLPENSKTISVELNTSRFSSAIWYNKVQEKVITLAGLGGIGSYVYYLLTRMQPSFITIYDPDVVEAVNMSGQLYSKEDLGKYKTQAMLDMAHNYSNYYRTGAFAEPFTSTSFATSIMICGFDNMTARKIFFNSWRKHVELKPDSEQKHCLFIDGRLAAEEFQVFCIRGDDKYNINRYANEFLFSDSEADETICSYKQTTFMANMIGSIIVNLFVNFCANDLEDEEKPLLERDLPFLTTYDASSMMFITNH